MQRNTVKESLKKGLSVLVLPNRLQGSRVCALLHAADRIFSSWIWSMRLTDSEIQGLCRAGRAAGILPMARVPQNESFLITERRMWALWVWLCRESTLLQRPDQQSDT